MQNIDSIVLHVATHALFDLAAHPEYLKPLREEVEIVTKQDGWSKFAVDQMHKLDSFLKESQRFNPIGISKLVHSSTTWAIMLTSDVLMKRYVLDDYTFSDGITVPAGTFISISIPSIHLDPAVYKDPLKFDGFQFTEI